MGSPEPIRHPGGPDRRARAQREPEGRILRPSPALAERREQWQRPRATVDDHELALDASPERLARFDAAVTDVHTSVALFNRGFYGDPVPLGLCAAVQRKAAALAALETAQIHAVAAEGVAGGGGPLPHLDVIQAAFGHHDVRGVVAHVGGAAQASAELIGAEAYATGSRVAFRGTPSLHTAAHEAAHVVQQRAGVSLAGGVGAVGDRWERHADAVADAVVRGHDAAPLLDRVAGGGGGGVAAGGAVQRLAKGEITKVLKKHGTVPAHAGPMTDLLSLIADRFKITSAAQVERFIAPIERIFSLRGLDEGQRFMRRVLPTLKSINGAMSFVKLVGAIATPINLAADVLINIPAVAEQLGAATTQAAKAKDDARKRVHEARRYFAANDQHAAMMVADNVADSVGGRFTMRTIVNHVVNGSQVNYHKKIAAVVAALRTWIDAEAGFYRAVADALLTVAGTAANAAGVAALLVPAVGEVVGTAAALVSVSVWLIQTIGGTAKAQAVATAPLKASETFMRQLAEKLLAAPA
ncbi:MAG: DUF4157 domain-containing protein [Deltaproteobacteria bacterium]|nr:DUF4157 domain-containing protein [Deltaproteobacteria bacterium]